MILLKATKKQSFTLSVKDTVLEKPQGVKIDPPSPFRVNTIQLYYFLTLFSFHYFSFRFVLFSSLNCKRDC